MFNSGLSPGSNIGFLPHWTLRANIGRTTFSGLTIHNVLLACFSCGCVIGSLLSSFLWNCRRVFSYITICSVGTFIAIEYAKRLNTLLSLVKRFAGFRPSLFRVSTTATIISVWKLLACCLPPSRFTSTYALINHCVPSFCV